MKTINVLYNADATKNTAVEKIAVLLDKQDKNAIEYVPWPSYSYKPNVSFAIVHSNDCIFLKYYVTERNLKAVHRETNGPVYKDCCVEFFIAFNGEAAYYNFEFNCLGTCLMGFGEGRNNRKLLPLNIIHSIKHHVILSADNKNSPPVISWELTLKIPLEVFYFHDLTSLKGNECKANFYKCGDELPEPHYLAWNNISSKQPDFHLPEFFGKAHFM